MLQNPTKHQSREEIRKQKLADIGVDVNDIEAQQIEDSALPNKIPPALSKQKPKPKVQDVESTFKEYGFKVSFYVTIFFITFGNKPLTEDECNTKKYKNLVESHHKRMDKLFRKLEKGMLINSNVLNEIIRMK